MLYYYFKSDMILSLPVFVCASNKYTNCVLHRPAKDPTHICVHTSFLRYIAMFFVVKLSWSTYFYG